MAAVGLGSAPPFEVLDDDCLDEEVRDVESKGTKEGLDVDVKITVEGDTLDFGSDMTIHVTICWGVEAAGEEVEETEVVTGDGVNDELDCSWMGVDGGIALDVNGGALEGGVSVEKENGVEIAVDVVKGIDTVTC